MARVALYLERSIWLNHDGRQYGARKKTRRILEKGKNMGHRLSKSKLQSHAQCAKRLWLELHAPQLAEVDDASQLVFDRGNAFGEAVRTLFPDGELIDTLDVREALDRTAALLDAFKAGQRKVPLFEAAFQFENVLVRVDVLEPQPDGRWRLIDVSVIDAKAARRQAVPA